jgi:hypothetical protein
MKVDQVFCAGALSLLRLEGSLYVDSTLWGFNREGNHGRATAGCCEGSGAVLARCIWGWGTPLVSLWVNGHRSTVGSGFMRLPQNSGTVESEAAVVPLSDALRPSSGRRMPDTAIRLRV